MPLFKKNDVTPPVRPSGPPASAATGAARQAPAADTGPAMREKIGQVSAAIDVFVTGDFRDASHTQTIVRCLGASLAPRHFPDQSIWAKSIPFADQAAAIGEWLIIVKLYQLCAYWNDDAFPQLQQTNPQFCELLGWARPGDRAVLRDKAFDAATRLPASLVVFPSSHETVGEILWSESIALQRPVDWLARTEPPPPAPPNGLALASDAVM
jgi:hypothetical protein